MYDVVVIGGGASGLFAAIHAAKKLNNGRVAIVERNQRVGKKILITGNGRCNITNKHIEISRYHSENLSFVENILKSYDFNKTEEFFNQIGIVYYYEDDKVFPHSLQASSVVDMLRFKAQELGIDEICDFQCVSIQKSNMFKLTSKDNKSISAKTVVAACGGAAAPKCGTEGTFYNILKGFGHRMNRIFPSLVQIKSDPKKVVPLKGVKVNGEISIYVNNEKVKTEAGEILFAEYGLSGPPVFQISRIASESFADNKNCYVTIDLMPSLSEEEVLAIIINRNKNLTLDIFTNGLFNKAVGREIIKSSTDYKLNNQATILKDCDYVNIAKTIKKWTFEIKGTKGWDSAQVTAGGIKTEGVEPNTLESKFCEGLFVCGEILDVDGDCGGFNLQWAWSSGAIAGISAANKILKGSLK